MAEGGSETAATSDLGSGGADFRFDVLLLHRRTVEVFALGVWCGQRASEGGSETRPTQANLPFRDVRT